MNPADLFAHEDNPVTLASGEFLFKAGDAADGMFVLLEGSLDVVVGDKTVEHSQRGAIIGEMALVDHSPRGATVVARESAKLAKLDERRFQRLVQQNPFFATHVMKVLVDRLRQMNQLIAQSKSA
ncbi:MAG: cyclic nucleotide-binding domain-containing protein [Verrucomicrobia bacterium]|nr:MAG: cyclic nucleotide-binding domain-containing protein [Verrucomicrobiota bacterium]